MNYGVKFDDRSPTSARQACGFFTFFSRRALTSGKEALPFDSTRDASIPQIADNLIITSLRDQIH